MLFISCHFIPLKSLTLRVDSVKLLDVLTSLPVSHAILPRAVCFATSRPANHAICSFIDSSGYASGPIRRCLFIDYIIITIIAYQIQMIKQDISFGWTISMSNKSANSKLVNILFKSFCSIRYSCTLTKCAYYSHQKDLFCQIKEYPM